MFFLFFLAEQPKLTPPIATEIVVAQNYGASDLALPPTIQKPQNSHRVVETTSKKKPENKNSEFKNSELELSPQQRPILQSNITTPAIAFPGINIVAQEREGDRQIFEIPVETEESETEPAPIPIDTVDVVEVIADRQEYDRDTQVITAEGNVVMRFAEAVLTSDRIQVNLADRLVVAQGDVTLTRGEQIIKGSRFEYYLVQDRGVVIDANGQIDRSVLNRDLTNRLPEDRTIPDRALSDRLAISQPVTDVVSNSQFQVSISSGRDFNILQPNPNRRQGSINRVRFEADKMEFEGSSWQAVNLRLTNDPFSPPELELRANTAKFEQTEPLVSQLTTTKSRLVIDDSLSIPLLKNRFVFDRRPRNPGLFDIGFDGDERGGLFIERTWNIINREQTSWSITPQYFIQRALIPDLFGFSDEDEGGIFSSETLGLKSQFNTVFSPRNSLRASTSITGFDLENFDESIRAKIVATRLIGNLNSPYSFSLEGNFRERLFNGSLGFQTVNSSIGGIITSPNITLGKTGIVLQYQGSIQNINADTDREEFLGNDEDDELTNLTRYQGAAFLGRSFGLWQGKTLPITKDGALRYSPYPIVPYLQLNTGISSVASFYSSNDDQISLRGNIGIQGQFGNFSRKWFDYTGFNITYSIGTITGESPFLFDRDADLQTLSLAIDQQLYGPIRLGVQTAFNLDNGDDISTDYIIQYGRRTHNITLRYNPVLEIGSFSFQINDFAWRGNPEPFAENDIRPVIQGVER